MGLFDLFGNNKKKAEEEEQLAAQQKENERQREIEDAKAAHAGMPWPGVMKINLMKNKEQGQAPSAEDPVSPERKDEIGQLIYEPKLTPEQVSGLNLQELMFLLDAHILFNKKAPLPNYENNHRVMYNDLLRRIHEADKLYVLYNKATGYPLLDGPFALIYLDKEHAEQAAKLYQQQFRQAVAMERPGEAAPDTPDGKRPVVLFDYLFYLGIENILIDNGWYKAAIHRSEISAPPTAFVMNDDAKNNTPAAPELSFAMLDFINEATWPVRYDKREQNLKARMDRINQLIPAARYVVPVQQPTQEDLEKAKAAGGQNAIRLPLVRMKRRNAKGVEEDKNLLPVFTDLFEYSKGFRQEGFRPAVFAFDKIPGILGNADGFVINPRGASIIVPREALIRMTQTAAAGAGEGQPGSVQDGSEFAAAAQAKGAAVSADAADGKEGGKILQFPGGPKEEPQQ